MGGGGKGDEGGESSIETEETSSSYISPDQLPYLQDMWGTSQGLNQWSRKGMKEQTPDAVDWMNQIRDDSNPAWQQQLQGGAYQGMDLQGQMNNLLAQDPNQRSNMQDIDAMIMGGEGNNYADAMRGQYINDANTATQNMLSNTDARATASGMSGGSRHGLLQTAGLNDINTNLQNNLGQLGYETFDKDLNRKLDIAQQADMNNMNRYNTQFSGLENMLGQEQQAMAGGLQYGSNMQDLGMGAYSPYNAPWTSQNNYANNIGAPVMNVDQSMTQTQVESSGGGGGKGMMGTLGSVAGGVGGAFIGQPALGAAAGGAIGGSMD